MFRLAMPGNLLSGQILASLSYSLTCFTKRIQSLIAGYILGGLHPNVTPYELKDTSTVYARNYSIKRQGRLLKTRWSIETVLLMVEGAALIKYWYFYHF